MSILSKAKLRERTEQLRAVAFELEMDFEEKDEFGMIALLRDFKLFKIGGSKKITNILSKTSGLMEEKINVFDYRYTVSTGKSSHTFHQSVFFIQSKQLAMPQMLLKPENFFHKIGAWLGMQDIDFEEHPEFSDRYLLQGEDEERIRRTMSNETVMRFFTVEKNWSLESIGFYLVLYQERKLIDPGHFKTLYGKGMKLYEQLKTEEW
jgi:hypothetical protein